MRLIEDTLRVTRVEIQSDVDGLVAGPSQFNLYGRNSKKSMWTLLAEVRDVMYSKPGEKHRVSFISRVPFNQFKFENFTRGSKGECEWKVQSLNLYAMRVHPESVLSYSSISERYSGVEMTTLIPVDGYNDFSITPELPSGLQLDSRNG